MMKLARLLTPLNPPFDYAQGKPCQEQAGMIGLLTCFLCDFVVNDV
jgi:hypothetical protein